MKTIFLRVIEADNKAAALLEAVRDPESSNGRQRFELDPTSFTVVPGSPFAYWVSQRVRDLFFKCQTLEALDLDRIARRGLGTNDDFRFLRLWFEVQSAVGGWVTLAKGGNFSRFYASLPAVLNWRALGAQLRAFFLHNGESPSRNIRSESEYTRPGLTWPRRTNGLSLRVMPAGCIFGDKGPAAFVKGDNGFELLALAAITNSRAFGLLVSLQLARTELAQSFEVGLLQTTPVPSLSDVDRDALAQLARRAWSLKRSLDTRTDTSHAFTLPALLQLAETDLAARAAAWSEHVCALETELVAIQAEIDEHCFVLYSIDEADRRAITEGYGGNAAEAESSGDEAEDDPGEDVEEDTSAVNAASIAAELVSWAVGVAFGRFDVRVATRARPMPTEPEPFDPLPACSPGMLTGDDGTPLNLPPTDYPLAFPETGVLVDDPGHAHDLTAAVRAVFDVIFAAGADRWWDDVAALVDPNGHDLRAWLANSFFEHHLRRHSKSRRKAPIVWQLGTPSGSYSVWLYAHRLTRDSFFQIQSEFVGPKLTHEERQLTSLMENAASSPSASARKEIAFEEVVVEELRSMLEEIKRVAPLWNPNLDDGVVLTMAPLWRLVPQYKPWQKELKAKWDELAVGKYDWAHVAMHLWPERVVPKCVTDRSLAIAHDLENEFWVEGTDGKWKSRPTPLRSVEELVRERSSAAVKAALKSVLDAPTASGRGRTRSRRVAPPGIEGRD